MKKEKILKKLKKISTDTMKNGLFYHDHAHILAVYSNVEKLLKFENGNRLVLLTAALFHDIKREIPNHNIEAAEYTKKLLLNIDEFPKDLINQVTDVIKTHNRDPKNNDEKIFFDADKMETFSDLGIIRAFMIYAKEGLSLEESVNDYINFIDKQYKSLHTKAAQKLAQEDYRKCKAFAESLILSYPNS